MMHTPENEQQMPDVDGSEESLLNVARAVWQARWLTLFLLVAGAFVGVLYEAQQPRFRTTTTIRWLSPNISYLYSGYWDIIGRIRSDQLRSIIGGHSQAAQISLRTEKDSWIARLEVLHDNAGAGATVAEEVLRSLQRLDEQHCSTAPPPAVAAHPLRQLQQTLTELESLLATMPTDQSAFTSAQPDDPVTRLNQQFTSEAGPRLPLENMPLFPWYRSLQVRTSRLLSATASGGGPQIPTQTIQRLVELQQTSTTQLLQYWWSQDLLVSTGPLPVPNVEGISEQPVGGLRRRLQSGLVGLWIAGVAAVLLAVPLRWLRLRWREIVRPEIPPGGSCVR